VTNFPRHKQLIVSIDTASISGYLEVLENLDLFELKGEDIFLLNSAQPRHKNLRGNHSCRACAPFPHRCLGIKTGLFSSPYSCWVAQCSNLGLYPYHFVPCVAPYFTVEYGGRTFLRNSGLFLSVYMSLCSRR
jgi:hypothetical protein